MRAKPEADMTIIERSTVAAPGAARRRIVVLSFGRRRSSTANLHCWLCMRPSVGCPLDRERMKTCYKRAEQYWLDIQNKDNGSFPYRSNDYSGSMTCAGIASLIITGSGLQSLEAQARGNQIACCEANENRDLPIRKALHWFKMQTDQRQQIIQGNPGSGGNSWYLYYMYALERTGRMTGNRFIGNIDWYREGAQVLRARQIPGAGSFQGGANENSDVVNTSFALLFLSKGKRQIVISRMQYGLGDDWNHHSRAMQHLTAHTERVWKRDLAWQSVDINRATVKDLLETPVLFISGTQAIQLSEAQRKVLHDYVEQGGFIFAEACNQDGCRGEAFENSFRKFVTDVFEQPLEKLPPDHPIWAAEARVDPQSLPHDFWLYGVQSCCRLGLVYSPISLSCRWELDMPYGRHEPFQPKLQSELDNAVKIGINVLAYATGKQLKDKLDAVSILEGDLPSAPADRGTLIIPKLQHNAGADDAPRSLSTLMLWLDRENPFQISNERRMIAIDNKELQNYPVTFIHGRGTLRFSERQRAALREYFENGGFLFGDAICANEEFASSLRREWELALPEAKLQKVPVDHPMLSKAFRGFDVRSVRVLDPTPTDEKVLAGERTTAPQLEMLVLGDRVVGVFSPWDMSCALESKHSLQCRGYHREDAAKLGINIILFALQQ
ncbi:MAG: DUF4159 domain-containing protein [Pirellulales bacterium]